MVRSFCITVLLTPYTHPVSLPASGSVEARRPADSARRPGGRKPDAGAVRQVGGRQHQNEALDGGDLCAFNRQRQAVVQVEVTSFSPLLPLSPSHSGKGETVWLGAGNGSQGAAFCCLMTFFASSIPYQLAARFLLSFFLTP